MSAPVERKKPFHGGADFTSGIPVPIKHTVDEGGLTLEFRNRFVAGLFANKMKGSYEDSAVLQHMGTSVLISLTEQAKADGKSVDDLKEILEAKLVENQKEIS